MRDCNPVNRLFTQVIYGDSLLQTEDNVPGIEMLHNHSCLQKSGIDGIDSLPRVMAG